MITFVMCIQEVSHFGIVCITRYPELSQLSILICTEHISAVVFSVLVLWHIIQILVMLTEVFLVTPGKCRKRDLPPLCWMASHWGYSLHRQWWVLFCGLICLLIMNCCYCEFLYLFSTVSVKVTESHPCMNVSVEMFSQILIFQSGVVCPSYSPPSIKYCLHVCTSGTKLKLSLILLQLNAFVFNIEYQFVCISFFYQFWLPVYVGILGLVTMVSHGIHESNSQIKMLAVLYVPIVFLI
jgi:hypothetical protein